MLKEVRPALAHYVSIKLGYEQDTQNSGYISVKFCKIISLQLNNEESQLSQRDHATLDQLKSCRSTGAQLREKSLLEKAAIGA